jgi:molecular chaperone DnaJ
MCNGSGKVSHAYKDVNFQLQQDIRVCSECQGNGRMGNLILESCSLDIPIQPGFSETALFFQNKGHIDLNGNSGDLYINILYKPHEIFTQKGNDLYMDLELEFKDSLLGIEMDIEFLDGSTREIPIDRPVKPGTLLRVKGVGINKKGSLYIKIKVINFPTKLTDEQRDAIDTLF